jgi:hypothetical protein
MLSLPRLRQLVETVNGLKFPRRRAKRRVEEDAHRSAVFHVRILTVFLKRISAMELHCRRRLSLAAHM